MPKFGKWLRTDQQTRAEISSLIPVKLKPVASSEQSLYLRGSGAYTTNQEQQAAPSKDILKMLRRFPSFGYCIINQSFVGRALALS